MLHENKLTSKTEKKILSKTEQNVRFRFPVDRWLDAGEGDKRISLDLEPDKKPSP